MQRDILQFMAELLQQVEQIEEGKRILENTLDIN